MRLIDVVVRSPNSPGDILHGQAIACPDCGNATFKLFYTGTDLNHLHMQCTKCDTTYCDQTCNHAAL